MESFRSQRFRKQYRKLPKPLQRRVIERLELFLRDPFNPLLENHPLSGKYQGQRSINITGDTRVIYYALNDGNVVLLLVGTHHELYGS